MSVTRQYQNWKSFSFVQGNLLAINKISRHDVLSNTSQLGVNAALFLRDLIIVLSSEFVTFDYAHQLQISAKIRIQTGLTLWVVLAYIFKIKTLVTKLKTVGIDHIIGLCNLLVRKILTYIYWTIKIQVSLKFLNSFFVTLNVCCISES